MKKFLLGFAALTLILSSCSQNEIVDNINSEKGLIKFSAISGKVSTKAAETVLNDLYAGVDVFALITKNGTTYEHYFTDVISYNSGWNTDFKRFLKEGYTNVFYSVHPQGTVTAEDLIDGAIGFDYIVDNPDVDLLGATATATNTASTNGGVPVTLTFNHLLSQVNFGVKNNIAALGNVLITDISFNNVGAKGSYKFGAEGKGASNWTPAPTSPRSTFTIPQTQTIDTKKHKPETTVTDAYLPGGSDDFATAMAASSLMPMPLAFATSSITFKFRAYDLAGAEVTNGETTGTIPLDVTTPWKQGLRYIYVVDFEPWFKKRELKFTVDLSDWENYDWESTDKGVVEVTFN